MSVVEWAEGGGLSLRVKRDERVGGLLLDGVDMSVAAWCQILFVVKTSHINPSLNGQPQSSVFQSRCVATSISVLVLLCCPTFARCPITFSLTVVISLLFAP